MPQETIAEIMLRMRLKERRTSLDRLAEITGKNKATIRKYEKEEIHIPRDIAFKLAKAYFTKAKEQQKFMEIYREEISLRQGQRKQNRNRKKERTTAGRKYEAVLRLVPLHGQKVEMTEAHMLIEKHDSYLGLEVIVDVLEKYSQKSLCRFSGDGLYFQLGKTHEFVHGKNAIKAMRIFSQKNKLGVFSLADLALAKVENSDLFEIGKYERGASTDSKVFIVEESLLNKMSKLPLKEVRIYLEYIRSRGMEVSALKQKLIASIRRVTDSLSVIP